MIEEKSNTRDPEKSQGDNSGNHDTVQSNDEVDFNDLLSAAGEFGKYQVLLFCSTFPFYVFGVVVYFSQLFITEVSPNHWCWIPELENLTDTHRRSLAIPLDVNSQFGYSQCRAYVANWTDVLITGSTPDGTWNTTTCKYGWEFNKTEIPYPTITSEMGWVCEKNSYQATAQAIFCFGSIVGGLVIGKVSDRFGRLPAIAFANLVGCVGGVASIFSRNFIDFAFYRFLVGFSYDNCMMMVYLLVLEYVVPKYRTFMANGSFALFFSPTVMALPWIALACGHWKTISLLTSLPLALAVFTPFIMPESPTWLLSKGRVNEAVNKIQTIGRRNKKEVPLKLIEKFKSSVSNGGLQKEESIRELLRRPALRKVFVFICLEYGICSLVFDGLVRSIGQLNFDFFISFSVMSVTEFPSIILLSFIMDFMGRRWLMCIALSISCIFCTLSVFIGGGIVSVMCVVFARFTINMAFNTAMQWAAEMLPVQVRGSGISIVHICGYIGALIAPYVIYLKTFIHWLPMVTVGSMAGVGAVIALKMPETTKKEMPQSFDDAEKLVREQSFWDIPCFIKLEQRPKYTDKHSR